MRAEFDGTADGPTLLVFGGLHANEPAGLLAGDRVVDRLRQVAPPAFRGRIVAITGHCRGLEYDPPAPRYIDHDLNRRFTPEAIEVARSTLPDDRGVEDRELLELLEAVRVEVQRARGPMYAVDLHTTSADSPPFLFVQDSIPVREIARQLPVPLVFGVEEELTGLLMDYLTEHLHLGTLVFESGRHDDPRSVELHTAALWMLLDAIGCLSLEALSHEVDPAAELRRAAGSHTRRVYDIRHRHEVRSSGFRMGDGLEVYDRVVAEWTELAFEEDTIARSPVSGLLFMPNQQEEIRLGDDGFFIVRRVGRIWLRLSAGFRRPEWTHRLLAHVPGIAPLPGSTTALLVDPEVAAFLKRRIFHLIGYRLVRRGADPRGHAFRRLARAVLACAGHAWQRLRRRPSPPLHPACPDDPHVWIIDRRTLDLHPICSGLVASDPVRSHRVAAGARGGGPIASIRADID